MIASLTLLLSTINVYVRAQVFLLTSWAHSGTVSNEVILWHSELPLCVAYTVLKAVACKLIAMLQLQGVSAANHAYKLLQNADAEKLQMQNAHTALQSRIALQGAPTATGEEHVHCLINNILPVSSIPLY